MTDGLCVCGVLDRQKYLVWERRSATHTHNTSRISHIMPTQSQARPQTAKTTTNHLSSCCLVADLLGLAEGKKHKQHTQPTEIAQCSLDTSLASELLCCSLLGRFVRRLGLRRKHKKRVSNCCALMPLGLLRVSTR
jgi:hypothetical protein